LRRRVWTKGRAQDAQKVGDEPERVLWNLKEGEHHASV